MPKEKIAGLFSPHILHANLGQELSYTMVSMSCIVQLRYTTWNELVQQMYICKL